MTARNNVGEFKSGGERNRVAVPSLLESMESLGIEEALRNRPGLLAELCRQVSAQGPFENTVYERLMRVYWEGVGRLVDTSPPVKEALNGIMPLTVNLEATDTPLLGHFRMRNGRVQGGPGMVPFPSQDFRFFGPKQVLMMLLNDELPLGYSDLHLHSEGHPGLGKRLFPVMRWIARLTKGTATALPSPV
jgi:hypothetical protein